MMNETEFKKLPKAQREAIQQRLKDANLYAGNIDGNWGAGTETALKQEERARVEGEERSRKGRIEEQAAEAEAEKKKAEADRERARAEAERAATERKRQYNETAASPEGIGTQIAAGPGAFLGGYAAGRGIGSGINRLADMSQESKNRVLQGAADDRLSGLTTTGGARTGTTRSGAMPSDNPLLRVGGRMLPHAITGASMIGKGGAMLAQGNEDDPFYSQMANRGAGIGMVGTGVGVLEQGANYAVNPGVAPDARSIAIMESNQLRRNALSGRPAANRGQIIDAEVMPDAPAQAALPAPETSSPAPGSKAYYVQEAKRLGVKGATRKTKADLVQAVNDANAGNATKRVRGPKKLPSVAGPLAAAGLAYMATPEDAYASTDGASVTGNDRALTNAGAAGGLTYGTNRLLNALPAGTGTLAGGMLGPLMPMTFDPLEGGSEEDTRHNIMSARGDLNALLPSVGRAIGVTPQEQSAYEMAQVPTPGPARVQRQADTRQDAEYMRRYLADEPTNMPAGADAGWQDRAQSAAPDDFDAQLAELQQLMIELEGPQEAPQPRAAVQMPPPPPYAAAQQNRLLAGR